MHIQWDNAPKSAQYMVIQDTFGYIDLLQILCEHLCSTMTHDKKPVVKVYCVILLAALSGR